MDSTDGFLFFCGFELSSHWPEPESIAIASEPLHRVTSLASPCVSVQTTEVSTDFDDDDRFSVSVSDKGPTESSLEPCLSLSRVDSTMASKETKDESKGSQGKRLSNLDHSNSDFLDSVFQFRCISFYSILKSRLVYWSVKSSARNLRLERVWESTVDGERIVFDDLRRIPLETVRRRWRRSQPPKHDSLSIRFAALFRLE